MSAEKIEARLFGTLTITSNGQQLNLAGSIVARSLLAYLLLNRQQPQARLKVIGHFWPDLPEDRARRSLSQALWQVRRDIPAGLIETTVDHIRILPDAPVWVDVEEFSSLTTSRLGFIQREPSDAQKNGTALRQAVQLYRGDLLDGVYDDWVLVQREYLRETYLQSLEQLITLEKSAGRYAQALEYALKIIQADEFREVVHREVMRLYFALGRIDAALKQYELCSKTLREELDVEPDETTQALAREIASHAAKQTGPYLPPAISYTAPWDAADSRQGTANLIGRAEERSILLKALEDSASAKGGIALIEGPPGVGKTHLLEMFARDVSWRGAEVLWGHGNETRTFSPYALIANAINDGLTTLRAKQLAHYVDEIWLSVLSPTIPNLPTALPELPPPVEMEPEQARERLMAAFGKLIAAWGQITPLVLILEDLHWADSDSLDLLISLVRYLNKPDILLIGSYRIGESRRNTSIWQKLETIDRSGSSRRITLENLTEQSTSVLIRQSLGLSQSAPIFEARLYQETSGNPLFLLETLRTLNEEGLLIQDENGQWSTAWDDTTSDYAEMPLSPVVERTIARRLKLLPDALLETLQLAAVLGDRFNFDLLCQSSNCSLQVLLPQVRQLIGHNYLAETAQGYRFSHAKVQQVVYDGMEVPQQVALHNQVAQALENMALSQFVDLARHYHQAGDLAKAAHYYARAGQESMTSNAFTEARKLFEQALGLATESALHIDEHFELLTAHEEICRVLGLHEDQNHDLATMQQLAQKHPPLLLTALLRTASSQANLGNYDNAENNAQKALNLAEKLKDQHCKAEAIMIMGTVVNWRGQPQEAIPSLEKAVGLAQKIDEPELEARAHDALANTLLGAKAYQQAQTEVERALAIYTRLDQPIGQANQFHLSGIISMEQGDYETAMGMYRRSMELCLETGYLYGEGRAHVNMANIHFHQGQTSRAMEGYTRAADLFQVIGNRRGEAMTRANLASLKTTILGDFAGARRDAETAQTLYRDMGDTVGEGQTLAVIGCIDCSELDFDSAIPSIESGIEKLLAGGEKWIAAQCYRSLIITLLANNQPERALEIIILTETLCNEMGYQDILICTQVLRGRVQSEMGRPAEGLRTIKEAMDKWREDIDQSYLLMYWYYQSLLTNQETSAAHRVLARTYRLLLQFIQGLTPEQQEHSLQDVPEHRVIINAWNQIQPETMQIKLPQANAPTGRPLKDDEFVEIAWTVKALEDIEIADRTTRRHKRMQRLMDEAHAKGAAPTITDLATALGVSTRTVKRDLAALRQAGQKVKTRGSS